MVLIFFLLVYPDVDKAVGIADKGELSDVTSNFGLFANLHYFTPSFHWPNSAPFQQQYCPGLGILAARNDTVIESFLNLASPEWAPLEGSFGTLYSGTVTTSDGTPIMATSDDIETWPLDAFGEPFWPGPYRLDTAGQEVVGEFTSDRDLFCVFNDQEVFGIQVDQSTYSYGRLYAQDFIFFDLQVYTTRTSPVDNTYLGFRGNFRCDYDMQDYVGLYRDSAVTFVYYWDADGMPQSPWETVGYIGIGFINPTIDNFHYYRKQDEPAEDFRLYPIIVSDPTDPAIDSSLYFHGSNVCIDDPSLVQSLPPESTSAYNFIVSAGPLGITPQETLQLIIVVVCGEDSMDLFDNLAMAMIMADNHFLGSGPPACPHVYSVSGDRNITLYWNAEPSESSSDIISGQKDFEGYKIYRSENQGSSWGREITNEKGEVVGYVPIAQYDLIDGIQGIDPAFPYQSLGDETGLVHSFVDSTVYNGIEYWYCVSAYDQGNQDSMPYEPSYENSKGRPSATNIVSAIPAPAQSGYIPPYVLGGDTLEPIGGSCEGLAMVNIMNPSDLQERTYEITFDDTSTSDSAWTTFNLVDVTSTQYAEQETLLFHQALSDMSLDNIPVIDGFRLTLLNTGSGIKSMEWTLVHGDTCGFQWWTWTEDYSSMVGPTEISGICDFKIVVDTGAHIPFGVIDGFGSDSLTFEMPLRVYDITDSLNHIDVSQHCWLLDYSFYDYFPPQTESLYFGPEGWDLVSGGAGYNSTAAGQAIGFFDQIGLYNDDPLTATGVVYFGTQNGPDSVAPPSQDDEFTIITYKPFSEKISYRFSIIPPSIDTNMIDLAHVKVVPNPYILHSRFEQTPYDRKLMFTNLPGSCEILIYNIAGEHIMTLQHRNNLGYEYWDLRTKHGLEIAYGLYVYVVTAENHTKAKGKFAIIK
jgi:hypothetical protein